MLWFLTIIQSHKCSEAPKDRLTYLLYISRPVEIISPCTDKYVFDLCEILLIDKTLPKPNDVFDAVTLYINLRSKILALL